MSGQGAHEVKVVQPGEGEKVAIPGFGAIYKIYSRNTGGEVAVVEHPFDVGTITAAHKHSREDEHSIVIEGRIGFRSDDSEVVLGVGGFITKPRGQMHAMGAAFVSAIGGTGASGFFAPARRSMSWPADVDIEDVVEGEQESDADDSDEEMGQRPDAESVQPRGYARRAVRVQLIGPVFLTRH